MASVLLTKMEYGKYCEVRLGNGKVYRRVVRYSKDRGLYVVIANTRHYQDEMVIETKDNDK